MTENTKDTWDAKLYATSFKFVPALADRVVSLLSPQPTGMVLSTITFLLKWLLLFYVEADTM
jgi:hypothetical protein